MKCLYCDRHLGFFHKGGKGAFCSEQHEELYRDAAQRRLETPYAPSAGTLENSIAEAEVETAQAEDLAKLLTATQVNSGSTVEKPAEVVIAAESTEAVMASVSNSAASTNARALPEMTPGGPSAHTGPPSSPAAGRPQEPAPASDAKMPASPEPSYAPVSAPAAEETDRRSEPRVKDIKIVKVATLRNPERETSCALVDSSETGIQFTSNADFPVGEILIAELPDQVVLSEVRYSQPKDGRYAIGTERAQSVSNDAMSQATTGLERAGVLIDALCNRVRTGFSEETGHGADAAGSDQRERALERVAKILEIWQSMKSDRAPQAEPPASTIEPVPDSTEEPQVETRHSSGAGRAFAAVAACLVLAGLLTLCVFQFRNNHASAPTAAPSNRDRKGVGALSEVAQQVKPQQATSSQLAQQVKPQPVAAPQVAQQIKAQPAATPQVVRQIEPQPSAAPGVAQQIKPRPAAAPQVAQQIKAQPAATPQVVRQIKPQPAAAPGVAQQIKPRPAAAPQVAQQVKPKPAAATPVQAPARVEAKPAPPVQQHAPASRRPAPKAEPITTQPASAAAGLHRAQITASQTTWVGISTDGKKIFGAMITKGSTKDLEYSKFAFVHAGNAAGIEITVDGQSVPMGKQPRLRLVELNATGYQFLRWINDDPPQP